MTTDCGENYISISPASCRVTCTRSVYMGFGQMTRNLIYDIKGQTLPFPICLWRALVEPRPRWVGIDMLPPLQRESPALQRLIPQSGREIRAGGLVDLQPMQTHYLPATHAWSLILKLWDWRRGCGVALLWNCGLAPCICLLPQALVCKAIGSCMLQTGFASKRECS